MILKIELWTLGFNLKIIFLTLLCGFHQESAR